MKLPRLFLTVAYVAVVGLSACLDPVQSRKEDALGPEVAGVSEGPLHRPGQPCTACHSLAGSAAPEYTVAGTIYDRRGSFTPVAGVTVSVQDRNGLVASVTTNEVGNFYIEANHYQPTYPLDVGLKLGAFTKKMETQIGRDGGCAGCHLGNGDASHAPAVFLKDTNDP